MARTVLFGVVGPFVGVALAAVGCGMTTIYIDTATGTTTTSTSATSSASGGAGGALLCAPGATQPCYSGPAGTEGQGICQAGAQACSADGMSWGPCSGEVVPGVEDCATAEDEDCDGIAPPCKGELLWAKRFGDVEDQAALAVAQDTEGHIYLTGRFHGTTDFGGEAHVSSGGSDAFVAKLDALGGYVWSKSFGDGLDQTGSALSVGAGGLVITGSFDGLMDLGGGQLASAGGMDVFVAKLDTSGSHIWSRSFGGPGSDDGSAVILDAAGDVFVSGSFHGAIDFGGGALKAAGVTPAMFLAKLDGADGHHVWSKSFGNGVASALAETDNGIVVAGSAYGPVNFGAGTVMVLGVQPFAAAFDSFGGYAWGRVFQGNAVVGATAVADERVFLVGSYFSTVDFGGGPLPSSALGSIFLAELGPNGAHSWSKPLSDGDGRAVAADAKGRVVAAGANGPGSLYLSKFGLGGDLIWNQDASSSASQAMSVSLDDSGSAILAGYFAGTLGLGGVTLVSAGAGDVLVAKFGP